MKKLLTCVTAAAVMIISATSYAAGSYDIDKSAASFSAAEGKNTVLIYEGTGDATSDNIVYVNQAANPFTAKTNFLLKANPLDGVYTVKFGSTMGTASADTFYIGMSPAAGDLEMTKISDESGYIKIDENKYNIGYTVDISLNDTYNSLIVKTKAGKYLGCANPLTDIKTTGQATAKIGIQINGVSSLDEIAGVWLSPRGIN